MAKLTHQTVLTSTPRKGRDWFGQAAFVKFSSQQNQETLVRSADFQRLLDNGAELLYI